VTEQQSVQPK